MDLAIGAFFGGRAADDNLCLEEWEAFAFLTEKASDCDATIGRVLSNGRRIETLERDIAPAPACRGPPPVRRC